MMINGSAILIYLFYFESDDIHSYGHKLNVFPGLDLYQACDIVLDKEIAIKWDGGENEMNR